MEHRGMRQEKKRSVFLDSSKPGATVSPLYKKILDFLPVPGFVLDRNGHIVYASQKFNEVLGPFTEHNGNLKKILSEEDWDVWNETLFRLSNSKDTENCVFNVRFAIKQELKYFRLQGNILEKDSQGKVMLYLFIGEEVTTHEPMPGFSNVISKTPLEKQLQRTIHELDRSNKDLEEFAYVASHDLQEPLRKITTFSTRLAAKFQNELSSEGKMYIDRINFAVNNMRDLIDNLLEISRTVQNPQPFVITDLNNILQQVKQNLDLKIEEGKAEIRVGELPVIEALPSLMFRLFDNLINNAIKFSTSDRTPEISITSREITTEEKEKLLLPPETCFEIAVKDNGIGFEQESAEDIFHIFHRLHGKTEYSGSGIGLAICKKIVEKHTGLIWAQAEPNKGATFFIILPKTSRN